MFVSGACECVFVCVGGMKVNVKMDGGGMGGCPALHPSRYLYLCHYHCRGH